MSPASQGSLEVERFIGTNLISSWARVNTARGNGKGRKPDKSGKAALAQRPVNGGGADQQFNRTVVRPGYQPNAVPATACDCSGSGGYAMPPPPRTQTWTPAGMPLAVAGKKKPAQQFQRGGGTVLVEDETALRTPLSRLAIHTQGAPLILAGRVNGLRKTPNRGPPQRVTRNELGARRSNKYKDNHPHGLNGTSDCLSVASDESSGSSHSENILPRIIKPRKRRKKDRKPVAGAVSEDVAKKEDSTAVGSARPQQQQQQTATATSAPRDVKPNQERNISSGSHFDDVSEEDLHCPKLHHSFEDVAESIELAPSSSSYVFPSTTMTMTSATSCQCHYCDPSGIWGANFYPRKEVQGGIRSFLTPASSVASKSLHYYTHSDLVLRRSWSEPIQSAWKTTPQRSNSFSMAESRKWSKSGADESGDGEAGKRGKVSTGNCLEVSTEIVTSPNGHRDIEIRFYSTSPPV